MTEKITITGLVHEAVAAAPEPLDLAGIVSYIQDHHPAPPKNPLQSARGAITQSRLLIHLLDGRYVYLPNALVSGAFRFSLIPPTFEHRRLFLDELAQVVFWPALFASGARRDDKPITVALADGPPVSLAPDFALFGGVTAAAPDEFWNWLAAYYPQPDDDLVIRVSPELPLRYSFEFAPLAGRDIERLQNRNRLLADLVCEIMDHRAYPIGLHELIPSLIAHGGFLDPDPPDALERLLEHDERIAHLGWNDYYLADAMTPDLRRRQEQFHQTMEYMADRIDYDPEIAADLLNRLSSGDPAVAFTAMQDAGLLDALGLTPDLLGDDLEDLSLFPFDDDLDSADPPFLLEKKGDRAKWKKDVYTLKVRLKWAKGVWRHIEIRGDQTLHQLHYAILDAYGWDEEHLYSFFLSNQLWDEDTQVASPFAQEGWDAEKVRMGALDLRVKDKFLFLFDYGDSHEFEITLTAVGATEKGAKYPRVVKEVGKVPPQYPDGEDDDL